MEKYDQTLMKIEGHNRTLTELNRITEELEEKFRQRDKEFIGLSMMVNDQAQYSRHTNLEIHGVKKEENQNLISLL